MRLFIIRGRVILKLSLKIIHWAKFSWGCLKRSHFKTFFSSITQFRAYTICGSTMGLGLLSRSRPPCPLPAWKNATLNTFYYSSKVQSIRKGSIPCGRGAGCQKSSDSRWHLHPYSLSCAVSKPGKISPITWCISSSWKWHKEEWFTWLCWGPFFLGLEPG